MAADADPGFESAARTARRLLATMWRVRALDQQLGREPGREAVAAGVCAQLAPDEPLYVSEHPFGEAVAKGVPMARLLAGPLDPSDLLEPDHGLLGSSGPAGAGLAEAVGTALAERVAGRTRPVVALFDAPAVGEHFLAAARLAARWRLPILFVCQRPGTDGPRSGDGPRLPRAAEVVAPFGVASSTVDGGDAAAVHDAVAGALSAAREGDGPFLLECLVPLPEPPAAGDPPSGPGDPLARLGRQAAVAGWFGPDDADAAEAAARAEVGAAVRAVGGGS